MKKICLALLSIFFLALSACTGIQYPDSVRPSDISDTGKDVTTNVLAKAEAWRNSGVVLKAGRQYRITAKGRWKAGPVCGWTGPDGIGAYTPLCWDVGMSIVKGWSISTLIAKNSEQGRPFALGEEYELVPKEDGVLFLRINDTMGYCGDNEGFLTVKVSIAGPESQARISPPLTQPPRPAPTGNGGPAVLPSPSQNWAVIIGISRYKYSSEEGLTNLIFADDDARAFARVLRNLGWNESHMKILVNEEATQRNIMIALESWLTKAGPEDQIVLFWAGHGFPDPEDPEKVYFACHDTDITIPATGYRMDRVRTALEERKARNVVLLADTCHAGKLITRGERGLSIVPQIDRMRRERQTPKGWVFLVGADTDRKAIEHTSWTNGAFTHCLVKGLSGEADGFESVGPKDGTVTMRELRAYLNTAMPDQTQRVLGVAKRPIITTSTGDPEIWNLTLQAR